MSRRRRHLVAYAASMLCLMVLQLVSATSLVSFFSDRELDIFYSILSQVICMGVVPLIVLISMREKSVKDTFLYMRYGKPKDAKITLLTSLALIVLITPFTMAFNALSNLFLTIIGYDRAHHLGTIYNGVGDLFLYLGITALLPAVFEEFSHRGVLLSGLEDRGSEKSAVILSAVMFGLMHENPTQMIFATFGGILFALVVIKTGSIIPAMCAHFANNAISVFLDYSSQRETTFGVWYNNFTSSSNSLYFIVTLVVMVAAVYGAVKLLQYLSRKNEKPITEEKLFGLITVDGYKPTGKATLRDNALLYATMIAESFALLFLVIWGIVR